GTLPAEIQTEQSAVHVLITTNDLTINPLHPSDDFYFDQPDIFRSKLISEKKGFEITNAAYNGVSQFSISGLLTDFAAATSIAYESAPDGTLQKRMISDARTIYLADDLVTPMPLGEMDSLAFTYQHYRLAFTPTLLNSLYSTRVTNSILQDGGYEQVDGINWWTVSGTNIYLGTAETPPQAAMRFYLPVEVKDALGSETKLFYDAYNILLTKTTDALQNTNYAKAVDYRILQPVTMVDLNNNYSEILADELGMVIVSSIYGDESDGVHGDQPLSAYTITSPANLADVINNSGNFLQQATSFFYYDLFVWKNSGEPVCFATLSRQTHESELIGGAKTRIFISVGHSSGLGKILQSKILTEPGDALKWTGGTLQDFPNTDPRWIGSGRTILNNKGNPVKQYEPFFSTTYEYETEDALVEIGFSPILFYDPVGRLIKTKYPDGTFSFVEFDAWKQLSYDQNDTVKDSDWYDKRIIHPDPAVATPEEIDAANKAAVHYDTPSQSHLDSLGRTIYAIADNGAFGKYATKTILDIENNQKQIIDARANTVMQSDYDMVSRAAHQLSMDSGERWNLSDTMNQQMYRWDSRDQRFREEYDELHRPLNHWLTQKVSTLSSAQLNQPVVKNTAQNPSEILTGLIIYGENQVLNGKTDTQLNLRGKSFQTYDQSCKIQTSEYDFKGNVKESNKHLALEYKNLSDWNIPNKTTLLDPAEIYSGSSRFDATSKPVMMKLPDGSQIFPSYNLSNWLLQLNVFVKSKNKTIAFVQQISYNAKGQRESIIYGNNTSTGYAYHKETYRLIRILTTRNKGTDIMQDLNYTSDPVGNITQIEDKAQQKIFFNNTGVDPGTLYEYDPVYRIISAEGREHAGQNAPGDQFDLDKSTDGAGNRLVFPGDMNAMQRYQEQYLYDDAGNMMQMVHNAGNGVFVNKWTKNFTYRAMNNQMVNSKVGALSINYTYDPHGNLYNLQSGSFPLTWNYADQLQQVDLGGGGIAYYVYDGSGQRVRKVIENKGLVKERIYLGNYEIYREKSGTNIKVERETLQIMDDKRRIALVETVSQGQDKGLPFLIRYQYANQLRSACLELTGTLNSADITFIPAIISYEEFYPFGDTAYQAMDNQTETAKRYRYTGMERDEESGMYYQGARYFIPWLARWSSCDPAGIGADGPNVYQYVRNNPIRMTDPMGLGGDDDEDTDDKTNPPVGGRDRYGTPVNLKPPDLFPYSPPNFLGSSDSTNLGIIDKTRDPDTLKERGGMDVEANLYGSQFQLTGLSKTTHYGFGLQNAQLQLRQGLLDVPGLDFGLTVGGNYSSQDTDTGTSKTGSFYGAGQVHYAHKFDTFGIGGYASGGGSYQRTDQQPELKGGTFSFTGVLAYLKDAPEEPKFLRLKDLSKPPESPYKLRLAEFDVNPSITYAEKGQLAQGPPLKNLFTTGLHVGGNVAIGKYWSVVLEGAALYGHGYPLPGQNQEVNAFLWKAGIAVTKSWVDSNGYGQQSNSLSIGAWYSEERDFVGGPDAAGSPSGTGLTRMITFGLSSGYRR
ncbi:MAG: hypothetical protein C5B59_18400, partial [Bacteroidetes bacterium]